MAALLPSAAQSLTVSVAGDGIEGSVSNQRVKTVADRVALLRARHGTVADLDLNDAANRSEQALHDAIDKPSIVLIRSQEIDAAGETDMLAAAWSHFSTVNQLLATVARVSRRLEFAASWSPPTTALSLSARASVPIG
jgi:hypothetical protein